MNYKRITVFDNSKNIIHLNLYLNNKQARIVVETENKGKNSISIKRHIIKRYKGTEAIVSKALCDYNKVIKQYKNKYNYVFNYDVNLPILKEFI